MAATGDATTGRPTALPARKVAGACLAGTACTAAVWLYEACGLPGTPVPPEVAAMLATLACVAAAYATAPAPIETVVAADGEAPLRPFAG